MSEEDQLTIDRLAGSNRGLLALADAKERRILELASTLRQMRSLIERHWHPTNRHEREARELAIEFAESALQEAA